MHCLFVQEIIKYEKVWFRMYLNFNSSLLDSKINVLKSTANSGQTIIILQPLIFKLGFL